jgi:hypothetical protein
VFRRRRNKAEADAPADAESAVPAEAAAPAGEPTAGEDQPRDGQAGLTGPWDATSAPQDDVARLDLGALQVPTLPDVEVRVEADQSGEVAAVLLVHGQSGVQLGAFAAPRSEGIWRDVLAEIGEGIVAEGGKIQEKDGEFGPELWAQVPTPEGPQPVRFVGVDGPRWFLRAVFTGAAATEPDAEKVLAESLRHVVVVRGNDPMPVRDPLPLRLPREVVEQASQPERKVVEPPQRGPEITEIG